MAGTGLIALGFADLFFAVLHYDGPDFVTPKLYRGIWKLVRAASRPLPPRARSFAYSLAGPVMIPATLTMWLGLEILGFAFLYTIGMNTAGFSLGSGLEPGFWQALYLSGVSISTLGFGDVTAVEPLYQALTFLQGLAGFSILTLSISYILGVYGVLGHLRAIALKLYIPGQADDSRALVERYLRSSHEPELGDRFKRLHDDVVDHYEGMRRYPIV